VVLVLVLVVLVVLVVRLVRVPVPGAGTVTTAMLHRCCPDHGDAPSSWLFPAGVGLGYLSQKNQRHQLHLWYRLFCA
jgi:hypothetical protein